MLAPGPQSPSIYQLLHYLYRPDKYFAKHSRRYGDVFSTKLAGLGQFVFVGNPQWIGEIFHTDPAVLKTGKANSFAKSLLGDNSILTLDGDAHASQRKTLTPPFLASTVQQHIPMMIDLCHQHINRWQTGKPVRLEDACREITLQAILRLVFDLSPGPQLDKLAEQLRQLMALLSHPLAFAAPILPRMLTGTINRAQQTVDQALLKLIGEKRNSSNFDRNGVMGAVLSIQNQQGDFLTDTQIRDHLFTLLLAGHDTTAIALGWAFADILQQPSVLANIDQELKLAGGEPALADANQLNYLQAAIHESLRLHSLVDYCVRHIDQPFQLDGITYPTGMTMAPCLLMVHHHPDVYSQPLDFLPERFIDKRPPAHTWIPFGGGRRRCLGMKLALLQMRVVLATVFSRVQFAPIRRRDHVQRRGLFLAPSDRALRVPVKILPKPK